jgi:hypothetical protein
MKPHGWKTRDRSKAPAASFERSVDDSYIGLIR